MLLLYDAMLERHALSAFANPDLTCRSLLSPRGPLVWIYIFGRFLALDFQSHQPDSRFRDKGTLQVPSQLPPTFFQIEPSSLTQSVLG